jgi:hypothetical protein
MTITLTQCDGGGHVQIFVDGEPAATAIYDDLLAGVVQAGQNVFA